MLRQSIRRFLENKYKYQYRLGKKYGVTMAKLNDNNFHKKLRDEILMIPIPKPKFVNQQSSTNYEGKQSHEGKTIAFLGFRNRSSKQIMIIQVLSLI